MAIYFIGGPPKCGKTTLAKTMCENFKISWISSDTLQNIVRAYTPKEKHASLFPHSNLRGKNNDEFYNKYSTEQIVKDYITQGQTTYDAMSIVAETYLTDKDDFIIEGYAVTPEIVDRVIQKFGKEHIQAVFLIKQDEASLVNNFHKSTTPNDWILRKTKEGATYTKIAKMITKYSEYFEEGANRYDLPIFKMDDDFQAKINEAINFLRK